jgi:corrinoid protein of di/trimethylamine methyltransferase
MPGKEAVYEQLKEAIIAGDREKTLKAVDAALKGGVSASDVIEKGMSPGMREVGEKFARYEIYLPEMMMAAEAWEGAMKVLEPKLVEGGKVAKKVGKVVLGTVAGDIHSIGKNIVGAMLKMSGFEVYDLGIDVPASHFVTKAEEVGADVIAASAPMSTTMPQQKNIIDHLKARGVREKYAVLVGGGSTTEDWAKQVGADGYGKTAGDATALAMQMVSKKGAK